MALTGKQKRFLRGRGHSLQPGVQIGKEGLTDAIIQALDQALLDHELVKVRIGQNSVVERKQAARELAVLTGSEVAQVLGNTLLLYRARPEDPVLVLP